MKKHLLLVGACVWMMLSAHAQNLKLWYQQPAKTWVEALPVGNSSMGADGLWRNIARRIAVE